MWTKVCVESRSAWISIFVPIECFDEPFTWPRAPNKLEPYFRVLLEVSVHFGVSLPISALPTEDKPSREHKRENRVFECNSTLLWDVLFLKACSETTQNAASLMSFFTSGTPFVKIVSINIFFVEILVLLFAISRQCFTEYRYRDQIWKVHAGNRALLNEIRSCLFFQSTYCEAHPAQCQNSI